MKNIFPTEPANDDIGLPESSPAIQCTIVGSYQCLQYATLTCTRCGRAVCAEYHVEWFKEHPTSAPTAICKVCLYPERYPRDPAVGRWKPLHGRRKPS